MHNIFPQYIPYQGDTDIAIFLLSLARKQLVWQESGYICNEVLAHDIDRRPWHGKLVTYWISDMLAYNDGCRIYTLRSWADAIKNRIYNPDEINNFRIQWIDYLIEHLSKQ